ncbi:FIST N-terminal domain-containing protein [uncultured Piscinibacter sp.]|uniref:FIST signal transduction protein n=1 Tax=uncultured Piscinibacter sp. TaxID=1131835 RepID=UPI00262D0329|nr:FIST N-terminal domain-containing protein [uncultured Piscinibacter sp.]
MKTFLQAHAAHPDWRFALAMVQPQLEAQQRARAPCEPTLGWVYLTDHYAGEAEALLAELQRHWPGVSWVGAVGIGVSASGVEYFDEPALTVMLAELPQGDFRVFSGARPLGTFPAHTAQVHADPNTPDLAELVADMSDRTTTGYLFGGLASARNRTLHVADGVLHGGLSGVAFASGVGLVSRVTQGCQPVGRTRTITESSQNVITRLDGEPALDVLLADLNVAGREPREALPQIRQTLVGLSDPNDPARRSDDSPAVRRGAFGPDTRVRHLIGLDPARRGIAIGDIAPEGLQLAFCQRNTEAARRDLVRICAEIREELAPQELTVAATLPAGVAPESAAMSIAGAVYVSCSGRGGPHFGGPSAELQIVRRALGDVPLVGFFAAGEIARHHLYGYTGVLTVFAGHV